MKKIMKLAAPVAALVGVMALPLAALADATSTAAIGDASAAIEAAVTNGFYDNLPAILTAIGGLFAVLLVIGLLMKLFKRSAR